MLKVEHKSHSQLAILLRPNWKEWCLCGAIVLFALAPITFTQSTGSFDIIMKILFAIVFIWVGVLQISGKETCTIDKDKKEVRLVTQQLFIGQRTYCYPLSTLQK